MSFALASCAKGAGAVAPIAVPVAEYGRMDCNQLLNARLANVQTVAALSSSQDRASTNDAVGVLLIGLPIGSMGGGDREGDLAVAKGRDLSLASLIAAKNCDGRGGFVEARSRSTARLDSSLQSDGSGLLSAPVR